MILPLVLALALIPNSALAGPLTAQSGVFRDCQGRTVLLRGVNVAGNSKRPPYIPFALPGTFPAVSDTSKLDVLQYFGMNVIRLLFTWEAYEPLPGQYNGAYLSELVRVADAAWERGIYTIVDMHQDSFSRDLDTGCGEGFPGWIVPAGLRDPHSPDRSYCSPLWPVKSLLDLDMHESFKRFYANESGVRDAFLQTWARVALAFRGHPGVIGYDLLNEPWGLEQSEIAPLYEDATRIIRAADPGAIVFVEPLAFLTSNGFRQTALPRPSFQNFAYAPHFYDAGAIGAGVWDPALDYVEKDGFAKMAAKAKEWGAPLFVGEFGGPAKMKNVTRYVDDHYSLLDEHLASGTQWTYTPEWNPETLDGWNGEDDSIVNGQGNYRANYVVRPHVRAVSGALLEERFKRSADGAFESFEVSWEDDGSGSETEIYFPSTLFYSDDNDTPGCGFRSPSSYVCRASGRGPMHVKFVRQP
ncbi:MAG: glycoside hydrolase family 5 protein [Bdellovibrionota bacterium]